MRSSLVDPNGFFRSLRSGVRCCDQTDEGDIGTTAQSPLNRAKGQRGRVAQAHSEAILFRTASCCKAVFANAVRATGCRIFMPFVAFACARALDV